MPAAPRRRNIALALRGGWEATSKDVPPVASRSLADRAYAAIKAAVIRCELEPGLAVTEAQLATQFRVGRAAVRAALKRLCQERLVEVALRQRYRIAPITIRHVKELFEVRALLEPSAARSAAGRIDSAHLRRLDELCQARYIVGDAESARAFLQLNTEFHSTIVRACGNDLLAETIVGVLEKIERVHHLGHLLRDRNEQAFHEHHDLVEALVDGDGERAYEITRTQIDSARQFAIDGLLASPSLQTVNIDAGRLRVASPTR
ncbi:MAG: GntR family transcriptional regulator [Chloroflexi bacterium]|nr:GntR family transcriptional regulator [Chloroflexota bacterium]